MGKTEIKKSNSLKKEFEAWNIFLESFGNLLPGGIGVYECSDKIRPLYLSSGALQLCHGFEEDFYDKAKENAEFLLTEHHAQRLRDEVQMAVETGKVLDCELHYRMMPKKNGWVWVRGRILRRYRRRHIFIAIILDVTRQKKLEHELAVQNERYRLLEETSDEILFEVNVLEDTMTYSYKEIDGELIRRRVPHYSEMLQKYPLVHPEHMEMFCRHLNTAAGKKAEGQFEYLSKISGRGYEWHWLYYTSIEDESGNVIRIIGRIKNIHDEMLRRQEAKTEWERKLYEKSGIRGKIQDTLENAELEDTHAMAIVAIDHFKKIVEQNGVACGDAVLFKAMDLIQKEVDGHAMLGRMGDGRILLYLKNLSEEELDSIMEHIVSMIEHEDNKVADLSLSCCIGAALMQGAVNFSVFYEEVEEALHLAKITKGERYIRV